MQPITPSQLVVLQRIEAFYKNYKYFPTAGKMAKAMGLARSGIWKHFQNLKKNGWIILDEDGRITSLPHLP